MREFDYVFDKGLANGLRSETAVPRNTQTLVELKNARPSKLGLTPLIPLTNPWPTIAFDWPFPQFFRCRERWLVGERNRLWRGELGILHLVADPFHVGADEALWEVADYDNFHVITKGGTFLTTRNPVSTAWTTAAISATIPNCTTLCDFNGQLMAGGLSPWLGHTELSAKYVAWSDIGSASFVQTKRNEAGLRKVSFIGEVVAVRKLGDHVVVYGYEGIGRLTPVVQPAPTFGWKEMADVGMFEKGAVGGNELKHLFVSIDGYLYAVDVSNMQVVRLGFGEFMQPLMTDYIMVSYVGGKEGGDFYISDGNTGYILTPQGLAQTYQRVSSATLVAGVAQGSFDNDTDTEFLLTTDVLDFEIRGQKTIMLLEVGCSGINPYYAAVDWRMNPQTPFQRTPWVQLNNEGVATLPIAGTEFRLCLRCATCTDINVSYIRARYKVTDLRGLRGEYPRREALI